ncbi:MAG: hypothetical protein AB7T06_26495 [Kofleriaceae bacterium]
MRLMTLASTLLLFSSLTLGCGDDGHSHGDDNEVITTVTLDFAPMGGGTAVSASFRDDDGDGGNAPTIDPINLTNGTTYNLSVRFLNELETPAEEITEEVMDESDQHQIFLTGTAVNGPATNNPTAPLTHTYTDMDANGLPIGLSNRIVAATGTGQLTLTLRHMPPVNDQPVKVAGLADQVKTGGVAAIGGSTDVSVTFMATVQ